VLIIKPLERADRDQLTAATDTEEGDGGIEQAIDLERVRILWRAVRTPELQMMLDELSYVIEPWISDRDVELIHRHAILTVRFPPLSTRAPCTLEAPDSDLFGPVALVRHSCLSRQSDVSLPRGLCRRQVCF
jgi:hypothetical protein